MKVITANELHARAQGVRIVDVREPREYCGEIGHIAGSLLVPLAELEAAAQRWSRSAPVVLVCRSGSRSAIGCGVLEKLGFESVTNLAGGMLAWSKAGLPVDR
jgi:rhodanese-related sulfurtransferase